MVDVRSYLPTNDVTIQGGRESAARQDRSSEKSLGGQHHGHAAEPTVQSFSARSQDRCHRFEVDLFPSDRCRSQRDRYRWPESTFSRTQSCASDRAPITIPYVSGNKEPTKYTRIGLSL